MSSKFQTSCCAILLISWSFAVAAIDAYGQAPPAPPAAPAGAPSQLDDPQVLEQGPLHEAFAEPLALEQQAAEIVPRRPPEPIEELPPELEPEGHNVQWIPGYFQWQADLEDFVWVSGLYRDLPPGRKWIPGAWHEVEDGWQWAPGFWAEGDMQELNYLPTPPATLEQGPSSPAPGDNYLWAPGCWRWRGDGYAWQTGYWYEVQTDWVWVPSHYCYTPYGSVFVRGYWDYPFGLRGLLYAPLYWGRGANFYAGYYYRPRYVLNTALIIGSLFIDRHYNHFYYGYNRYGNQPAWLHDWGYDHGRHGHRNYYDPLYAQHEWNDRHGDRGRDGPRGDFRARDGDRLVTDVNQLDRKRRGEMKLRQVDNAQQTAERTRSDQYRQFSQRRAESAGAEQSAGTAQVRRRSESGATEARARFENRSQVQNDGSTGDQRSRAFSRGQDRVSGDSNVQQAENGQGRRRSSDADQGTVSSERREQFRSRSNSGDDSQVRSGSVPSTFSQQNGSPSARTRQRLNTTQGNVVQGNDSAPRSYRVMRSQSSQNSRGTAQQSASRIRSFSGGSQQPARVQSFRRSGGGGGGGGNFQRSGSFGGGEGRSGGGGGGGSRGRGGGGGRGRR